MASKTHHEDAVATETVRWCYPEGIEPDEDYNARAAALVAHVFGITVPVRPNWGRVINKHWLRFNNPNQLNYQSVDEGADRAYSLLHMELSYGQDEPVPATFVIETEKLGAPYDGFTNDSGEYVPAGRKRIVTNAAPVADEEAGNAFIQQLWQELQRKREAEDEGFFVDAEPVQQEDESF